MEQNENDKIPYTFGNNNDDKKESKEEGGGGGLAFKRTKTKRFNN